jgi:hypothetical protein
MTTSEVKPLNQMRQKYEEGRLFWAIRKTLLGCRDHELTSGALFARFPWASKELFDRVITECLQEGLLTERPSNRPPGVVYTWHDEKAHEGVQ